MSRARGQRAEMTDGERLLWMLLRGRRFGGVKLRRLVPLGDFVVDFACMDRKLVVELDGSQHAGAEQKAFDAQRTAKLEAAGIHVVRVWTGDLNIDREGVLEAVWQGLHRNREGEGRTEE
ncbi:MAG: endonuclease domain-containing protein [Hyphomonadaceae bacterium]